MLEGSESGLEGLLLGPKRGHEGGVVSDAVVEGLCEGTRECAEKGVFLRVRGNRGRRKV